MSTGRRVVGRRAFGRRPDRYEYVLPSLGADMDSGRVVEWLVAVGDTVRRGDVVAVVETEKSDIDIEIWRDGVVEALLAPLGEEVAVGTPLAVLAPLGQPPSDPASPPVGGRADRGRQARRVGDR